MALFFYGKRNRDFFLNGNDITLLKCFEQRNDKIEFKGSHLTKRITKYFGENRT